MASLFQKLSAAKLKQAWWLMRGGVGHDPVAWANNELPPEALRKTDIVLTLARHFGLKAYLELCSNVAGNFYRAIRESGLDCRRLMYLTAWYRSDGLPIDYRSRDMTIADQIEQIRRSGWRPDICLVDSWHEYEPSLRDIRAAYDLLADGGAMLVHDCLPPSLDMAGPQPSPGCWCGYSHRAFIDFVWTTPGCRFFTVDCDYGCGVIVKGGVESPFPADPTGAEPLLAGWRELAGDPAGSFAFLEQHKQVLLNLVSAEAFLAAFFQAASVAVAVG